MAAAALIVSILSALGVLWIGREQLRQGREQLRLARQQANMEEQRELARTAPKIVLTPRAIANAGPDRYEYRVEICNSSDVAARDVQIKAFVHGQLAAVDEPRNAQRQSIGERVLAISFAGSSEELSRATGFVAIDRDGREWRYDP
jgi:hypothetical protein